MQEVLSMAELITEYIDAKNIKHAVQHITVPSEDNYEKERLTEELYSVLSRKRDNTLPQ